MAGSSVASAAVHAGLAAELPRVVAPLGGGASGLALGRGASELDSADSDEQIGHVDAMAWSLGRESFA